MKVIISHDVDHINVGEHWKDLYIPKYIIRSAIELIRHQISIKVFVFRFFSVFEKRIHRIPELCKFDQENGVKATYFFGMANVLGMSYKKENALPWINYVKKNGFDAGVHGCDYLHQDNITDEHDAFAKLTGDTEFGLRNHYVRFDDDTFNKMNKANYLFDSSEFNKTCIEHKDPYRVGAMWEFPLTIMEGYVLHHNLDEAKEKVINVLCETQSKGGKYVTILFHDLFYNAKCYPLEKEFYEWIIGYLKSQKIEFVSFKEAIKELEDERKY